MKIKIKRIDFIVYALFLAIFKIYLIPQGLQQLIKIVLLLLVIIFLSSRIRKKDYINIVFFMGISIVVSGVLGYKDGVVGVQSIYNGFLHALCIYLILQLIRYCSRINYFEGLIKDIFYIDSLYCILSILSMVFLGHSSKGSEIVYLFGYKFMTSYYFFLWLALFRTRYQEMIEKKIRFKIFYFVMVFVVFFICRWLYCSTTMIACLFLIIEQFIPEKVKKVIYNRTITFLAIVISGSIPLFIGILLGNDFIQYIIVELLHKNINLTGRTTIYNFIVELMFKRPWTGYGYGNNIVEQYVGFGNAQNGLLQQIIDYGFIGLFLFLLVIWNSLKGTMGNNKLDGLYVVLYALIICASVEISYNFIFYLVLLIVANYRNDSMIKDSKLLFNKNRGFSQGREE